MHDRRIQKVLIWQERNLRYMLPCFRHIVRAQLERHNEINHDGLKQYVVTTTCRVAQDIFKSSMSKIGANSISKIASAVVFCRYLHGGVNCKNVFRHVQKTSHVETYRCSFQCWPHLPSIDILCRTAHVRSPELR